MQAHPRPSNEIAEELMRRAEQARGASIWHSLYAPALAVIHDPSDHPGYDDMILTHSHVADVSYAPGKVAYLNAKRGARS